MSGGAAVNGDAMDDGLSDSHLIPIREGHELF